MAHLWKYFQVTSLEQKVKSMASTTASAYNIPLQMTPKNVIVTEQNVQENNEMVDIPDLPLDALEEAMAEAPKDLTVQDESGGSVVFGIVGSGQAGR